MEEVNWRLDDLKKQAIRSFRKELRDYDKWLTGLLHARRTGEYRTTGIIDQITKK